MDAARVLTALSRCFGIGGIKVGDSCRKCPAHASFGLEFAQGTRLGSGDSSYNDSWRVSWMIAGLLWVRRKVNQGRREESPDTALRQQRNLLGLWLGG